MFTRSLRQASFCAAVPALLAAGTAAHAQATEYLNRTLFAMQSGAVTTLTFENLGYTTGPATGTSFPGGATVGGVTFKGLDGDTVEIIDGLNVGSPNNTVLLSTAVSPYGSATTLNRMLVTLPSPVFSVGFDIKDSNSTGGALPQGSDGQYQVLLFDAAGNAISATPSNLVSTPLYNSFSFIGFTSTTPIASLQINKAVALGGDPVIDNFSLSAAPEPSAWAAMGVGVLGIGGLLLRRRIGQNA